ncbi:hypothetical protein V1511DRAFT_455458 [Dipodascopsis uninucleata]
MSRSFKGTDFLVAVHDFSRRTADELTLKKGDRIEVLETDDGFSDGWYMGRNLTTDQTGLFPYVYTALSKAPSSPSQSSNNPSMSPPTNEEAFADSSQKHASIYEAFNDIENALSGLGPSVNNTLAPETVISWTPQDVYLYFQQQDFDPDVCDKFTEHKITGAILLELELSHLKELDIASFGTRFEVNKEIEKLRQASKSGTSSVSSNYPPQYVNNRHRSVMPLETDSRARLNPRELGHTRQRSRSVEMTSDTSSPHHQATPSFDRGWQIPASPSFTGYSQSPESTREVVPLAPSHKQHFTDNSTPEDTPSIPSLPRTPSLATQENRDSRSAGFHNYPESPDRRGRPARGLGLSNAGIPTTPGSVHNKASSISSISSRGSSFVDESRMRSQLHSVQESIDTVVGSGLESRQSMPATKRDSGMFRTSMSGSPIASKKSNSLAASAEITDISSVPTSSHTSMTPPTLSSSFVNDEGYLDSAALKNRSVHTFGGSPHKLENHSPRRNQTVPVDNTSSSPSGANKRLSTSNLNISEPRSLSSSAFKPKRLGKQNTSAFTEGIQHISPAQSASTGDHFGWMSKRGGSGVGTWKSRFFVLHGTRLSYFSSRNDEREKGLIDITAHKVVPIRANEDKLVALYAASTGSGRYSFKLMPPLPGSRKGVTFTAPKVHYFAVDSKEELRGWMNALMKATIDRDDTVPVISSCNTPTVSLARARELNQLAMEARAEELRLTSMQIEGNESVSTMSTPDLSVSKESDGSEQHDVLPDTINNGFKGLSISEGSKVDEN